MEHTGGAGGAPSRQVATSEPPLVRVLGSCVVERTGTDGAAVGNDGTVELSGIQRSIVARMALARPGWVGVDDLAEAIWGDEPPATARTSIHNQISRIRTRLGSEVIVTEGGRYTLSTPTDAERVTDALRMVDAAMADRRFADAAEVARTALQFWRGDPFDELGELDEARQERVRLTEVHRSLETLRLEAALGDGQMGWAIPEGERLVDDTPDDEHRWVLLVQALGAAGRRGDALGVYERARRALADHLGLEPGPELRAAESAILEVAGGAAPARGVTPLVGRVDLLAEAVARCDRGTAVLLSGETGIGKTRVLQELSRRLRRRRIVVANATCSLHSDTAIATLAELAENLRAPLDPAMPPLVAFADSVHSSLGESGRVVLVVDDLDLAGPTSSQALEAAAAIDGVVLVASVTETDLLPPTLVTAVIRMGPLSEVEIAELVAARPGEPHPVAAREQQWLIQMSGGNPAIVEHLLGDPLWYERAELMTSDTGELPPPSDALRKVLRLRVDRLGATTRSTVETASVLGVTCPADLLAALASSRGTPGAVGAGLLVESAAEDGSAWLTFRHGAIQRILHDDLSPGRRMEIHHRAAALLRSAGAPAGSVATHSLASAEVDPTAALDDSATAAREATVHGAHDDAAQWYRRALGVIDTTGTSERRRVEAMVGLGDSLRLAGSPDQELALFGAADAAFSLGEDELIGEAVFAVLQLGVTTESGHVHERAIELADRALTILESPDHRALVAGGASLAHSMTGNAVLCRDLFLTAEASAQSAATRRCVLPFAYLALGHPRDLDQREQITSELLELGRSADDPIALFEALQLGFSVGLQRCDGDQARNAVAESAHLIERLGDVGRRWALAYQQAAVAHLDGELELAESLSETAFELFAPVSPSRAMAAYGAQILAIRLAQGRLDELTGTIEDLVADQPGVPAWHAALALAVAATEPDRAQRHAAAALDGVPEDFTWLAAHVIGGRAAAAAADHGTRNRYVERLRPYSSQGCWQGTCSYGPVDTVLAQLYRSLDDPEMADRHRSLALVAARRLESPVFEREAEGIDTTVGHP